MLHLYTLCRWIGHGYNKVIDALPNHKFYGVSYFYCFAYPFMLQVDMIYRDKSVGNLIRISVVKPSKENELKQNGQPNGSSLNISPYSPQRASVTL